jgi:small multidrug resistance pump
MGYVFLALTIVCEVSGTTFMKLSEGFTKPLFAAAALACYLSTMALMTMALKYLNLSLVYAVWSAVGLTLITVLGIIVFKEQLSWQKVVFMSLILVGVVGLNLLREPGKG